MRILALAAVALLAQDAPKLDDYYKFKTDTTWTYKVFSDGKERKIVGRVTGEEEGRVKIDWKDYEKDGTLHESSVVSWFVSEGKLTVESRPENGDGGILSFAVLKDGSKQNDRWSSTGAEMVHMGTTELAVPQGNHKAAVWTQLKLGEAGSETKIDFYLAPKIGLLMVLVHAADGKDTRFELAEFSEPKK
jgi:hypothetical protein